jgi:hypothetical protein
MVAWSLGSQMSSSRTWSSFMPWAMLHLVLFLSAWWIMSQPMDMRGTFLGG